MSKRTGHSKVPDMSAGAAVSAKTAGLDSTTDRIVDSLNKVDGKVTGMRAKRMADPDTLGDKAIKSLLPALTGLVAGRVFQMVWDAVTKKDAPALGDGKDRQNGLIMSMLFAAASAAFSTLITRVSDKGAVSFVNHRQEKRAR